MNAAEMDPIQAQEEIAAELAEILTPYLKRS